MSKISNFCRDRAVFYSDKTRDDTLLDQCKEMLRLDMEVIKDLKDALNSIAANPDEFSYKTQAVEIAREAVEKTKGR